MPECLLQSNEDPIVWDLHQSEGVGHVAVRWHTLLLFKTNCNLIYRDSDFISERKISCDMSRPGCRNCAASFRNCQGYGLRLSWPANSSSRSIHCSIQGNSPDWSNENKPAYFINTLMMDVETYYLQCPGSVGQFFRLLLNLFVYRVYVTDFIDR